MAERALHVTCMLLVLSNKGKEMQSSSEQPLVGEERYVTTLITAAKETTNCPAGNLICQTAAGKTICYQVN